VPYLAVALLANLVTAVPTYQIQRRLVFRATGPWWPGFRRFYVLCLGSLACVTIGLPLLVEIGGLPVLLAQALVIGGSPLVNYQLARLWAFRARTTRPLAATAASGCRASTTSSTFSGESTHISGTSIR
jgi:GtrA-like protein